MGVGMMYTPVEDMRLLLRLQVAGEKGLQLLYAARMLLCCPSLVERPIDGISRTGRDATAVRLLGGGTV